MLILHTSDWHLGRSLHGADLAPAHEAYLHHLVATVRSESVDVVVVAGDVFDRAIAPVEAVRQWDHALTELVGAGAAVVVSSGNHDSAARLGATSTLLDRAGVHVRTGLDRLLEPVLLSDEHGRVAFYALPYLEPAVCAAAVSALGPAGSSSSPVPRSQAGVVARACAAVRAHAATSGHRRTVVLAHTWVAGAEPGDTERDITCSSTVGTVDRVPVPVFEPFTYAALGHLHGAQRLRDNVRYSGSPVAFSFAEARQDKGNWLVHLDGDGLGEVRWLSAPVHRRLVQLRGTMAELLAHEPEGGAEGGATAAYVKAVVTDPVRPQDGMRRLQERYPYAVTMQWEPEGVAARGGSTYSARVAASAGDLELATGFVEHVRGTAADPDEVAVLSRALEATRPVEVVR